MGAQVGHDIVRSYLVELRPHLNHIDAGLRELWRITPDALAVSQAVQSISLVRGSSYVLALDDIEAVAAALRDAVSNVQEYPSARRVESCEHLLHLAVALRQAAERVDTERAMVPVELVHFVSTHPDDGAETGEDESLDEYPAESLDEVSSDLGDTATISAVEENIGMVEHAAPIDTDVREIFYQEARELFDAFTASASTLTQQADDVEALNDLRRSVHTLKGAANMTGFPLVGRVGGALEGLLDGFADQQLPPDRSALEVVLVARRFLAAMLASLDDLVEFERPVTAIEIRCGQLRNELAPMEPGMLGGGAVTATGDEQSQDAGRAELDARLSSEHEAGDSEVVSGDVDGSEAFDAYNEAPSVNLYELATEIASMARVQSSLRPHNAAIMPDDLDSLTDHINALTAEIEPPGTEELIAEATFAELDHASDVVSPSAVTPASELAGVVNVELSPPGPAAVSLFGTGHSELGSALLDLALGGGASAFTFAPQRATPTEGADTPLDGHALEREIRETFRDEAADLIDALTRAAMAMEHDPESREAAREAYRTLHTLKGAASVAGFDGISQRCHVLEDRLAGHATDDDIAAPRAAGILALVRDIEQELVDTLDVGSDDSVGEESVAIAASVTDVRIEVGQLDGLLDLVGELVVNRSTFEQQLQRFGSAIGELSLNVERLRRSSQLLEQDGFDARTLPLLGARPLAESEALEHSRELEFDPLELDRYTELDRLARELAEVASDIGAATGELQYLRSDFDTVSVRQQRLTTAMQDDLMRVRMLPARSLAPRLYRIVHGVALERGKDVDFVLDGGVTLFDTSLLGALNDSLAHLLRNAVDHGIESADERARVGRPARGRVRVRAYRDGNESVIEVSDDGRGIDHELVVARAVAQGYAVGVDTTRAEALELILLPGFSTRDAVDEVSGRGVGLDVVQGQSNG